MIPRKIESRIENFYKQNKRKALLIKGAAQTGKAYSIRQYGKKHFDNFIEINFLENTMAASLSHHFGFLGMQILKIAQINRN